MAALTWVLAHRTCEQIDDVEPPTFRARSALLIALVPAIGDRVARVLGLDVKVTRWAEWETSEETVWLLRFGLPVRAGGFVVGSADEVDRGWDVVFVGTHRDGERGLSSHVPRDEPG